MPLIIIQGVLFYFLAFMPAAAGAVGKCPEPALAMAEFPAELPELSDEYCAITLNVPEGRQKIRQHYLIRHQDIRNYTELYESRLIESGWQIIKSDEKAIDKKSFMLAVSARHPVKYKLELIFSNVMQQSLRNLRSQAEAASFNLVMILTETD